MMLEINLLPGAVKQERAKTWDAATIAQAAKEAVKDVWLVAAVVAVVASVAIGGALYHRQNVRAAEVDVALNRAVRDSTKYTKVITTRAALLVERDSLVRLLNIVRTIDDNRYNWAHILEEVSKALPAYTWLTVMEQTSKPPVPPGAQTPEAIAAAAAAAKLPKAKGAKRPALDTVVINPDLTFRIIGQTVDIQALTLFMRQLEASPFIRRVALTKSEIVMTEGKDVTQFELTAMYEVPPVEQLQVIRTVVPVR